MKSTSTSSPSSQHAADLVDAESSKHAVHLRHRLVGRLSDFVRDGIFRCQMFDTVKVIFHLKHEPLPVRMASDPDLKARCKRARAWGVYRVPDAHPGCSLLVSSWNHGRRLCVEGSLVKFLTGQNLIGTLCLHDLVLHVFDRVTDVLGLQPTPAEVVAVRHGHYQLNRLDFTQHRDCGTEASAIRTALAMKERVVSDAIEFSVYGMFETIYLRQHSTYGSFKGYLKGRQVNKRPIPGTVNIRASLSRIAQRLIRFEATFRASKLIQMKMHTGKAWRNPLRAAKNLEVLRDLMKEGMRQVKPFKRIAALPAPKKPLSLTEALCLDAWAHGRLHQLNLDRRALRRQRDNLARKIGIDILATTPPPQ